MTEINNPDRYQQSKEKHTAWQYNVLDKYKGMEVEEVKRAIQENTLPFAVLMQQIEYDINFGNIVRSANFLGAREIFYYSDKKKWDKRSACGCYHYSPVNFLRTLEEVKALKDKYIFIGVENNITNCTNIKNFKYPNRPILFFFGEEQNGIHSDLLKMMDHCVEIESRGSIRSMNVASVATCVMYDYTLKFKG